MGVGRVRVIILRVSHQNINTLRVILTLISGDSRLNYWPDRREQEWRELQIQTNPDHLLTCVRTSQCVETQSSNCVRPSVRPCQPLALSSNRSWLAWLEFSTGLTVGRLTPPRHCRHTPPPSPTTTTTTTTINTPVRYSVSRSEFSNRFVLSPSITSLARPL